MFSLQSADHVNNIYYTIVRAMTTYMYVQVFPLFHHLVCNDIMKLWEIAPIFKRNDDLHVIIADPFEVHVFVTVCIG